jgi:predicted PurR-regulated permease PerM
VTHLESSEPRARQPVPVRTIAMTIVMVGAAALLLLAIREVSRVLVWIVVAIFFAVALNPVVSWFDRKVTGHRRALSTLLVFLSLVVILGGLIAAFAVPLAREGTAFAGQLPSILDDAKAGRGTIGHFLDQTNALKLIQDHQDQIKHYASGLTTPAVGVLSGVATTVAGLVTILVLAYLMVLEAPKIIDSGLNLIDRTQTRERVRAVGADCARSVTGYLSGNLLISVICGVIHYVALRAMGVPFAGLIALFVAIADLVPLVGATIGGIVALLAAALHSLPALIVVAVVFVVYQQLENHLLQPLVFARTVNLNPLTVLVAILLAVELAGILGALLAIPVASIIQVISRDLWDHRRGRPKEQPTVGEERRDADAPESEDQVQQPASAGQVGS